MVKNKKNRVRKVLKVPRHVQLAGKLSGSCILSCVQQVMDYHGHFKPLEEILEESVHDKGGSAFDSESGRYALRQGFDVTINTYNCENFDPSWFKLRKRSLMRKIRKMMEYKKRKEGAESEEAEFYRGFLNFLKEGGEIRFRPLTKKLIKNCIDRGNPLIAGVYFELLCGEPRSFRRFADNDIYGEPTLHALVISGYDETIMVQSDDKIKVQTKVHITDPDDENPFSESGKYWYNADLFIANCNQTGGTTILIKP